MSFEEILNLDKKFSQSLQGTSHIGSSQTFSREVLVSAFSHLIDYQLLQISHDQNHRNFSNSPITILVHEDEIKTMEQ